MSAEENLAIAHHFFDSVWDKGDDSVLDKHLAEAFIEHFPGMESGRDGFRRTAQVFRAAFPDIRLTIEDEFASGDRVVHRWVWRCTHRGDLFGIAPTGNRLEFTGMTIVRLENGVIVERWSNIDSLTMFQQMGALPLVGQGSTGARASGQGDLP